MNPTHQQIEVAAYYLWETAYGSPDFEALMPYMNADYFWLQAEQQLRETGWEQKGNTL